MSVAVGTIKSRLGRARDRLAQILADGHVVANRRPPRCALDTFYRQVAAYKACLAALLEPARAKVAIPIASDVVAVVTLGSVYG